MAASVSAGVAAGTAGTPCQNAILTHLAVRGPVAAFLTVEMTVGEHRVTVHQPRGSVEDDTPHS